MWKKTAHMVSHLSDDYWSENKTIYSTILLISLGIKRFRFADIFVPCFLLFVLLWKIASFRQTFLDILFVVDGFSDWIKYKQLFINMSFSCAMSDARCD